MIGVTMADVLTKHQPEAGHQDMFMHCTCGWRGAVLQQDFLPHQADALVAAGFGHIGIALDDKAEQED